jgi:hypothetical protein
MEAGCDGYLADSATLLAGRSSPTSNALVYACASGPERPWCTDIGPLACALSFANANRSIGRASRLARVWVFASDKPLTALLPTRFSRLSIVSCPSGRRTAFRYDAS